MKDYKCDSCDKKFKQKTDFLRHKNRKKPCMNVPITIDDLCENVKDIENQCPYCHNTFTQKSSLTRHIEERCVIKIKQDQQKEDIVQRLIKEMEEMKSKVEVLEKENKNYKNQTNNITKNKIRNQQNIQTQNIENQQNNIQNFNLLAFGKEDMSHLADEMYKRILGKGFKSVPMLVEYVHFNKDKPENRNIYISNMRDNWVIIYDGEDWKLKERHEVMRQLLDGKSDILETKFEELIDELDEFTIRKFRRFLDEKDEKDVAASLKNDLKMILYNNKKLTEKIRYGSGINTDNQIIE